MSDMWSTLEEYSRAWTALDRQGLADAIWADYVSLRFGRTGDPRALEYLYPYLNHADRRTRQEAIEVAARVFEGRGPRALDGLDYFTKNPDPFLKDRAVVIVGAALTGSSASVLLDRLSPYLHHRNQFIQGLALDALGTASVAQANGEVLTEILRLAELPGIGRADVCRAIASVYSGKPTQAVYDLVAQYDQETQCDDSRTLAVLIRDADDPWYERGCREVFEPVLHAEGTWDQHFIRRDGIHALCMASRGRGMAPLERMLHLCGDRCTGRAMLSDTQNCFVGADTAQNRQALIDLAEGAQVPVQRVAALCLGRLVVGEEDEQAINKLRQLCDAPNMAVQAAALDGLGMAARSTCDDDLRQLCLKRSRTGETATAAIRCLGMVFMGSGNARVAGDIRELAHGLRSRPVRGKKHSRPLSACYRAMGLVYLGTGSREPVQSLLDVLALPRTSRWSEYRESAAKALVMVEFSGSSLGWEYVEPWPWALPDHDWQTGLPRIPLGD